MISSFLDESIANIECIYSGKVFSTNLQYKKFYQESILI